MTQHTQPLQHTPKNGAGIECQQNDHSNASITAQHSPISQSSKDITVSNVSIADAKELSSKCKMQDQPLSKHTAENVLVVERESRASLPSTTLTEMEKETEMQGGVDGIITVGSSKTISLKMAYDSFAIIEIVDADNSENAPTKVNAHLIAAAKGE